MGVSYYMAYERKGSIYIIYIGKNMFSDYDCDKLWNLLDEIQMNSADIDKPLSELSINDITTLVNIYNLTADLSIDCVLYCFFKDKGFEFVSEYEVNDWRKEGTRVIELGD